MRPEEKRSSLLDDYGNLRGWKFARLLVFPRSGESGRSGVGAEAAEWKEGRGGPSPFDHAHSLKFGRVTSQISQSSAKEQGLGCVMSHQRWHVRRITEPMAQCFAELCFCIFGFTERRVLVASHPFFCSASICAKYKFFWREYLPAMHEHARRKRDPSPSAHAHVPVRREIDDVSVRPILPQILLDILQYRFPFPSPLPSLVQTS